MLGNRRCRTPGRARQSKGLRAPKSHGRVCIVVTILPVRHPVNGILNQLETMHPAKLAGSGTAARIAPVRLKIPGAASCKG